MRAPFAAPFAVPKTDCPGCSETHEPGRTVEYQPPEYPGGSQADAARFVLWHSACANRADREATACDLCPDRHLIEGACLL